MSTLHVQLLGEFHLTYADAPVASLNQARQRSLLTYLLLHRRTPQTRQHLAFLLWPDSSEPQAYRNLRKNLHLLRQVLPNADRYLQSDVKTVQWRPDSPFVLDVAAFEHKLTAASQANITGDRANVQAYLTEAIGLYKGDLLPECYDDWILPERERLRAAYLDALLHLVDLLEAARAYEAAIHYAQQALRHDPLREDVYQRLMRLHLLNSDRASALRVYHTCASTLQSELGVEPNGQTRTIYENLLHFETLPISSPTLPSPPITRYALIGRHGEWRQLLATWHSVMGGRLRPPSMSRGTQGGPHFVLIAGEAGIGKTHLAEELSTWVSRQGMRTAWTRTYAAEGSLAYTPVAEWLRGDALRSQWRALDTVWLTELARLLPELLVEQSHLPPPQPLNERWQRQRLFEALARALLTSKQPLLLVLDDLQWCDHETLEWLHYLLRYEPQARLLIVGTVRPEEVDNTHPLTTLRFALRSTDQITEIELGPLDIGETTALATQVAGQQLTPEAVQRLYHDTEGNPLFVVETVRMALSRQGEEVRHEGLSLSLPSLPTKVQAIIQRRLVQLSPVAHELVNLAAVIGRSFTFTLLAQASAVSEDVLIRGLDELWQRRIVCEQGVAAYDFSHDRIRNVAYAEISSVRRRWLHHQVAQSLEKLSANELDNVCGQLAAHYEQAGAVEQAIIYYRRAASVMHRIFAYTEAIYHLHKSLALLNLLPANTTHIEQKLDSLLLLGGILIVMKGFTAPEVEAIYNQARMLCQQVTDAQKRFSVVVGLWSYWATYCRWLITTQLAEEMRQLAQETQDPIQLQIALQWTGTTLFHQGQFQAAHAYFAQALPFYCPQQRTAGQIFYEFDPSLANLSEFAATLWFLGYPEQAEARMDEMLAMAHALARPVDTFSALEFATELALRLRKHQKAQVLSEEMTALTAEHAFPYYTVGEILYRGYRLATQGEVKVGVRLLKQALATLHEEEILMYLPYRCSLLIEVYGQAQQFEHGLALLDDTLALAEETGEQFWNAELYRLRGELLLAQDIAKEEGEACFQHAIALARQQGTKALELRATMSLARLWQTQGKCTEAYHRLADIYSWFTEGFDTVDLQEAQALLVILSETSDN